uniref:Sialidase domain-containing protein n=1 Tax=Florenciella parvula TaxID=236787 RepID=A0A7S2D5J3_9STRA|mmetsp:Transcript_9308/g.19675  ORF Transcript_9308/g.19675 Transcript_9308/m.19675 type:complete len:374 (+) Transcript_9308:71-1192(+)|eukprot:CAMPEP_0182524550 /NCGR_PEP_ID=MMETSP1323-20130603/1857_1 /TAXON_ID=236787 /ORGANISM="Florenciella parvula, Strain RCC1693" /LENGTH=373 /DNA_ID=CAMNT_0024733131 /DNA_START=71 /DNA_END=1192 /DNA_ORIENTATION=+
MMKTAIMAMCLLAAATAQRVDVFWLNQTRGDTTYFCVKIPYVVETATGALLAFGEGRVGSCKDVAETHLIYRRSEDGGATWGDLQLMYADADHVIGNAVPVVDKESGRLFVGFNRDNQETWMTHSDDDGVTFEEPTYMPHLQDDAWKWIGLGPPKGLQLESGRLLLPGYHGDFWPFPDRSSVGSGFTKGHTIVSDDKGETWSILNHEFGEGHYVNELQAAQLANGTVVINAREFKDRRVLSYSDDEGETFYRVNEAADLHETYQGCEGSMITDAEGSKLYYSGVQGRTPARIYRENMTIFGSSDAGESWQLAQSVTEGASGYSAMQLLGKTDDGKDRVGILFERSDCTADHFRSTSCPTIFLPEYISWEVYEL